MQPRESLPVESKEYHNAALASHAYWLSRAGEDGQQVRLALRRHTDRCFFEVEEVAAHGYIIEGFLVDPDDVAELIELPGNGAALPKCDPSTQKDDPPTPEKATDQS